MNEQDLKRAFQDVVVASSPPPSMDPGIALDKAHKARSKRRASITGAAVAVLVVGVGLGSAFALNPQSTKDYLMGAGQSSSSNPGSPGMPDTQWGEEWPVGQSDRTATNGPQADRGTQLLNLAKASVPSGYDAPDLKYKDPSMYGGMLRAQAQISTNKGETPEVWEYTAYVPVRKDDKVGQLTVTVSMPNSRNQADPCVLANRVSGSADFSCKIYEVAGNQVGVASPVNPAQGTATTASYRAANGWTVTVTQEEEYSYSGYPKLDRQPFFAPELAALAADPKFLLGS
ncbi:hypothetical protein SAMN04488564_105275 [Lentzea waywayandensis]|uniref:Uncharacterized protein n=1 Tax=Lentzea waywayandensis TaxID=84724 RepID=A0A1I6ESY2_9PSEU|nr:hypothetical protein [Lentzea waywayandensis]SFR20598.1 hypothetical protein SAMN04488564_105275 [Lentzea waywayandensis]